MPDAPTITGAHPDLVGLLVPLDQLHQYHRNPNNGDTDVIAESLRANGQYRPIVVNRGTLTGRPDEVLGGNHTYAAALELGWTHIAATHVDVDDDRAARIVAVDNRSAELARRDPALLAELLSDLPDLEGTGYDQQWLDDLLADLTPLPPDVPDPDDAPPPPPVPHSVPGDVWILGPHRVICGDSTDVGVLDTVMAGSKAHCVWTDPPYGVEYTGAFSRNNRTAIENDNMDGPALTDFLAAAFVAALTATAPGSPWYVAAPPGPPLLAFAQTLTDLGVWRQNIAWVKDTFVVGRSHFHGRFEVLFYGWHPGASCTHPPPDRKQDNVWEIPRARASKDHPTQKPLALVQRSPENSTRKGDLVLDPFGGSGSTLLAAHATGRVARLVELDPRYVDVICRRYQQATGTVPILEQTREPHDFTADAPAPSDTKAGAHA